MIRQDRVYNFSAGPCCLPKEVLTKAQEELVDYHGTGYSVMEMSHRNPHFIAIAEKCEQDLRSILNIPEDFEVFLF